MWSQRKHKQAAGAQPFPGEPSWRMEQRWRKRANEMQIWGISEEQEPQIEEENAEESKWVSAIQGRLCHHLQGERLPCLPPLIASCRCQVYRGCLDAWACGSSCHVVATSIHASTCHLDSSSTPGVLCIDRKSDCGVLKTYDHASENVCTTARLWVYI